MTDTTTNRAYPYPQSTDSVNLWEHFQDLAEAIDTDVEAAVVRSREKLFCHVWDSSGQSLAHNTDTVISMESELVDSHNCHSTSVNTSRVTPSVPGCYRVRGTLFVPSRTGGYSLLAVAIGLNGTAQVPWVRQDFAGTSGSKSVQVCTEVACNGTTDYLELIGHQENSGSAAVVLPAAGSFASDLSVEFIRDLVP